MKCSQKFFIFCLLFFNSPFMVSILLLRQIVVCCICQKRSRFDEIIRHFLCQAAPRRTSSAGCAFVKTLALFLLLRVTVQRLRQIAFSFFRQVIFSPVAQVEPRSICVAFLFCLLIHLGVRCSVQSKRM